MRRLLAPAALTVALLPTACGGHGPEEAGRTCRRFAVTYSSGGGCALQGNSAVPRGRAYGRGGVSLRCGWVSYDYASLGDFILEAQVPNRLRLRSRTYSYCGTIMAGCGGNSYDYRYDPQGRLVERRRTGYATCDLCPDRQRSEWEWDRTTYDSWDEMGRPIAGTVVTSGDAEPLSITYDDSSGTMQTSTGERRAVDRYGNVLSETVVIGRERWEYTFVVAGTQEVCL